MVRADAVHPATRADAETVTTIITLAFAEDPLWSRALARPDRSTDHHRDFWRLLVAGALEHSGVWLSADHEAVAVWIPPGCRELGEEQERQLEALAHDRLGSGTANYLALLDRFEAAHPREEPHYYLSLLGTHPEHRGHGIGMRLLSTTLEMIDAVGFPAYLESSNPANNARYAGVGFEAVGEFSYPGGTPVVTTMWRPARRGDTPG
jgi:GNAT superfamily N-acetyltransferase